MSEEKYKEFREQLAHFLDKDGEDGTGETDEEMVELMRQLEVLKLRRIFLKAKKRKELLKEEIESKMAELKDLEEQENHEKKAKS